MERWKLLRGDCLEVLKTLPDNSVDSCVTDPPYGLSEHADVRNAIRYWFFGNTYDHKSAGFMGKEWDSFVPGPEVWREVYRVLKPGAYLLAFAGTRTQDLMGISIRFAGFEIREMIAWVYATGFPKSLDVGKKLEEWQGWGTALKPALEPVTVARKPLEGAIVENVSTYGTGAINVDGCRVVTDDKLGGGHSSSGQQMGGGWERPWMKDPEAVKANAERSRQAVAKAEELGRWPANLIHDGSSEVTDLFPSSEGRFFYCPKPSRKERDAGLENFEALQGGEATGRKEGSDGLKSPRSGAGRGGGSKNLHPTVKPTELMKYLCRLVTPPGGVVLDPFNGSGSTGVGALYEGMNYIGIEREDQYAEIAAARLKYAEEHSELKPFPKVGQKVGKEQVQEAVQSAERTIPLPENEELRKALGISEEVKTDKPTGSLSEAAFKRLVAKSLRK